MKRKTDNFSKFYNKKSNAAIKEGFRQEKKAAKKERKEAIERHFEEKRQAKAAQFEAAEVLKKLPGKKKPPTLTLKRGKNQSFDAQAGPASKASSASQSASRAASAGQVGSRALPNNQPAKSAPGGQSPAQKGSAQKGPTVPHGDNLIPLNKYIAHAGVCSRRDAAELIRQGKVQVNGQLITEPGLRVSPDDTVKFNGKKVTISKNFVYILINKPKDYITTMDDPQGRKTVLDLIKNATSERVYPVGRLDRNTSGVLLLTNDGDLAQKLSHPSHEIKKIYHVTLDKPLTKADFDTIAAGVTLEDGVAHVDVLAYADAKDKTQIGLEIHSGKNRIVRRIFEHLGYDVRGLDRVTYAGLTKKNLQRGHWRELTEKEIRILKYLNSSFRGSLAAPKAQGKVDRDEEGDDDMAVAPAPKKPAPKKFVGKKFGRPHNGEGGEKKFGRPHRPEDSPKGARKSKPAPENLRGRKSSGSYNKSKFSSRQDGTATPRNSKPGGRRPQ